MGIKYFMIEPCEDTIKRKDILVKQLAEDTDIITRIFRVEDNKHIKKYYKNSTRK